MPRTAGPVSGSAESVGSWTPSWTTSGTAPAVGNGVLWGYYALSGKRLTFTINLTAGSTTTFGTGVWQFTLPFTPAAIIQTAAGKAYDTSTNGDHIIVASIAASDPRVGPFATANGAAQLNATAPFTWANTDQLYVSGTLLLA